MTPLLMSADGGAAAGPSCADACTKAINPATDKISSAKSCFSIVAVLRSDNRSIPLADRPFPRLIIDRVLRRQLLIHIHTQSRRLIDIEISLLQFRTSREHFPQLIGEKDR